MSSVLTESAAGADFTTGLTVPSTGESGTIWWDLLIDAYQELADRTQALQLAAPGAKQVKIAIPMVPTMNYQSRFGANQDGQYWENSSVASIGGFIVPIGKLNPGIKIVNASMYWSGGDITGVPHSGLPQFLPVIKIERFNSAGSSSSSTVVGTATDSSANFTAYNANHEVVVTVNHTVLSNYSYYIRVTGENGTNAQAGSALAGLFITLAPP